MSTPTVREIVGDAVYGRIGRAMSDSFPDQRSRIRDAHVDAMIIHMWENASNAELQKLGMPRASAPMVAKIKKVLITAQPASSAAFTYYDVSAEHHRLFPPGDHFVGNLPMARVRLADSDATAKQKKTALGVYHPNDHLFSSVPQLEWEYSEELQAVSPKRVARVDLIAPMRHSGARFGAISIFLGYRQGDAAPSFYLLEAGFATGESGVPFLSANMGPIPPTISGYEPTPFSSDRNYYAGRLAMNGQHPQTLTVEVHNKTWVPPHLRLTVTFTQAANPTPVWPGWLIMEAAGRVGYIAERLGQPGLERLFASIGRAVSWKRRPG
jgi:hypothetical protein